MGKGAGAPASVFCDVELAAAVDSSRGCPTDGAASGWAHADGTVRRIDVTISEYGTDFVVFCMTAKLVNECYKEVTFG